MLVINGIRCWRGGTIVSTFIHWYCLIVVLFLFYWISFALLWWKISSRSFFFLSILLQFSVWSCFLLRVYWFGFCGASARTLALPTDYKGQLFLRPGGQTSLCLFFFLSVCVHALKSLDIGHWILDVISFLSCDFYVATYLNYYIFYSFCGSSATVSFYQHPAIWFILRRLLVHCFTWRPCAGVHLARIEFHFLIVWELIVAVIIFLLRHMRLLLSSRCLHGVFTMHDTGK